MWNFLQNTQLVPMSGHSTELSVTASNKLGKLFTSDKKSRYKRHTQV